MNIHPLDLAFYALRSYYNILKNPRSQMSKSLVLTMTPQLGLTSQNPSAYYWRPLSQIFCLDLIFSHLDLIFRLEIEIRSYYERV